MNDSFLNPRGLGELRTWILGKLGLKQDTLVSGTNIKTINNTSILGSGNIDITSDVTDVTVDGVSIVSSGIAAIDLTGKQDILSIATDSVAGIVKTNSEAGITVNAEGQLEIASEMELTDNGGLAFPVGHENQVGLNSILVTEGSQLTLGSKSLAVVTGSPLTLKTTAAAGATQYIVANNYTNRIYAAGLVGAAAALNETAAQDPDNVAIVTSVTINGSSFTPSSSADDSTKNIIITTNKSANPDSSATQIRFYPAEKGFSNLMVGQGIGGTNSNNPGASAQVGQRVISVSGNANILAGADIYNTGNGNTVTGRQHISRKNRWFMTGTGHDNSSGRSECGAVMGQWARISSDTLFAIGNGTSATARSNAFEIKTNGDIYKNGTKVL